MEFERPLASTRYTPDAICSGALTMHLSFLAPSYQELCHRVKVSTCFEAVCVVGLLSISNFKGAAGFHISKHSRSWTFSLKDDWPLAN